jgi:hypothetical protein
MSTLASRIFEKSFSDDKLDNLSASFFLISNFELSISTTMNGSLLFPNSFKSTLILILPLNYLLTPYINIFMITCFTFWESHEIVSGTSGAIVTYISIFLVFKSL